MLKRKILTTIIATPLSLLIIFAMFFGEWSMPLEVLAMSFTFALWLSPIVILYGVPMTLLSDLVSGKFFKRYRRTAAFLIHIAAGFLFGFIAPMDHHVWGEVVNGTLIFATLAAIAFWAIDEWLRPKKVNQKQSIS
ncbi:hypothetical protein LCM20_01385 [Halobacillus litoralis]|uniref:hypothetical protein n=1 Tax=Halobacillus litoralis TaxID=45668 RepID=UPI001CD57E34|nr:hypothetical protein [Halobacillus litoralis]MCA0969238.1 hypothetical protein [Halobacillus litoralis]